MASITFDKAIEVLEITNLNDLTEKSLKKQVLKYKKRWHPDTVASMNDEELSKRYQENFQLIEPAAEILLAYVKGEYKAGEKFQGNNRTRSKSDHEIIRENASEMQEKLRNLWQTIKDKKYKFQQKEILLSDGYVLKELLEEDFKEDIAKVSLISYWTYTNTIGLITLIGSIFSSTIGSFGLIFWLLHSLFCFLAFLPLSRFWLPEKIQVVMLWFVDFGLNIYNTLSRMFPISITVQIGLRIIKGMAFLVKFIFLWPLYEIAKLLIGDKVVGIVKEKVPYYADIADWYLDELLAKRPIEMAEQELYDLSYAYAELSDVQRVYA